MRLKEEREAKGLTQKEVADKIDITQASLSMIERGERVGSDKTKIKLSKLYGKTIDYLFFESKITKRDWMKTKCYKAERGESYFAPVTIRKYKKELARLKAEKEQLSNTSSKAQEIIESGKVNQWKKHPTIYFIKGLRKVAIELVDGSFKESPKYAAKTDEEKEIVNEILG